MRLFFILAVLTGVFGPSRAAEPIRAWERWDNCTHFADRFFDGDSFQVKHGRKSQIIRLYGADTPETDTTYARRLEEQAAYFGITPAAVERGADAAKEFTAKFLSKPFRVITRRKVAPGASRFERIYAIVERNGMALDAALIQAGLARATTETADYPDAAGGQKRFQELRALEQKAARERAGLWAKSQRLDPQPPLAERVTPRIFRPAAPSGFRRTNLNAASVPEIEGLPGIGPKTAEQIIRARPLKDLDALDALPGIGPKKIEALRELVSF
jgi:competence protein ComEA